LIGIGLALGMFIWAKMGKGKPDRNQGPLASSGKE
jgi:hypothetical protein